MCDALHYRLDNKIRFDSKLYRQIVGIPMDTNCTPLVADLFLFCYKRNFMLSLSDNNQKERKKYKNAVFIVGGDFNLPDIDWNTNTVTNKSK